MPESEDADEFDFPVVGTKAVSYLLCKIVHVTTQTLKLLFIQQIGVITFLTRIRGRSVVVVLICGIPVYHMSDLVLSKPGGGISVLFTTRFRSRKV